MTQPFSFPKSGGQCENLLPSLRQGCSGFPELSSFALQQGGLCASCMEKGEVLHLPSPDSRSWCFKKHPFHPPAPSRHLKCHGCFSKPTGIGKIAEQKQHCGTMVMVATENPSLGSSNRRRGPAPATGWGAMPGANSQGAGC